MTKPKKLSARDIRDLNTLRSSNGLRLPDLAGELGVAERTLARYFKGTAPRNNAKGTEVSRKLQSLLSEFRKSKNATSEQPIQFRKKRVHVSGVTLDVETINRLYLYTRNHELSFDELAELLQISSSHLFPVLLREANASLALRERINKLLSEDQQVSDKKTPPMQIPDAVVEEPVQASDSEVVYYNHNFRLRENFVISFSLPVDLEKDEAERLSAFIKLLPLR